MSLQNVVQKLRDDCEKLLMLRRLTQQEFAEKHALSYSWLNKFLRADDPNARLKSVERLQDAVAKEKRAS